MRGKRVLADIRREISSSCGGDEEEESLGWATGQTRAGRAGRRETAALPVARVPRHSHQCACSITRMLISPDRQVTSYVI